MFFHFCLWSFGFTLFITHIFCHFHFCCFTLFKTCTQIPFGFVVLSHWNMRQSVSPFSFFCSVNFLRCQWLTYLRVPCALRPRRIFLSFFQFWFRLRFFRLSFWVSIWIYFECNNFQRIGSGSSFESISIGHIMILSKL